jgi:hypothetical protein
MCLVTGGSLHRVFFFVSGGMLGIVFFISKFPCHRIWRIQKHEVSIDTGRGLVSVLMLSKHGKGSVGEGEVWKKAKTTPDAGGKSVSEKSQVTSTSKNPFRNQTVNRHNISFWRSCSQGQTDWEEWSWVPHRVVWLSSWQRWYVGTYH